MINKMEDRYTETHKTWNKIAQLYEDGFMHLELYDDTYKRFCNLLSNVDASILEIGCGPGNITENILKINSNLKIVATDVSVNMIELAKKNNPGISVKILDCRNMRELENKFDGIVCGFTIPYLSKEDCQQFISDCSKTLNENGILYISFVAGDYNKSGYISGSTDDRAYFYYHDLQILMQTLNLNQLEVVDLIEIEYIKSDKTPEMHTIINARKTIITI